MPLGPGWPKVVVTFCIGKRRPTPLRWAGLFMDERPIINADDLGLSAEVNQAIVISFRNSWINSASLMANMPGFDEACALLETEKLNGRVGVHLNLTSGHPLTERILRCPRFCDEHGLFRSRTGSPRQAALRLSSVERLAVREELEAQIRACMNRGLRPTHLDSHHHQHIEWAVGSVVVDLAREHKIPAVRIMRNVGRTGSLVKRLYRALFNARLRHFALARSRYFGDIKDAPGMLSLSRDVEIMVHPQLSKGVVVDAEDVPLGQLVNLLPAG